ncbi:TspO/MBR-related protein [Aspergillus sclerotioniger CBS 115572]|uniref:TspO/MBR-related protein n=1 Tax=Aspergillus sclerotioniger CBS 115572 TaxID=1450535 RepID=A0A317WT08_9EURO|nr:TspO/MBR-related protein [Aspergillus sclerotioniger CBS 115572]PWY89544.1 TspO/MBR-related protein [Aspergillus sclerotioniger CBS 115572]
MPWSTALPQAIFANPLASVVTPITTGSLIGYHTNRKGRTKQIYHSLKKPPLYPPTWLFPCAWTALYGMMGFAIHHATVSGTIATMDSSTIVQDWAVKSQTLYISQLALNHLWMPLFFMLRKPAWALADILLLGGNVAALMHIWWKHDRVAFWLMAPYAAWLGFATYLNAGVGMLNQWTIGGGQKKQE